jgi:hypothetical protein
MRRRLVNGSPFWQARCESTNMWAAGRVAHKNIRGRNMRRFEQIVKIFYTLIRAFCLGAHSLVHQALAKALSVIAADLGELSDARLNLAPIGRIAIEFGVKHDRRTVTLAFAVQV